VVVYLDASAALKLVVREAESGRLRRWLVDRPERASSALLRTELLRTVRREEPGKLDRAAAVLSRMSLHQVTDDILSAAARMDPLAPRSLDAIHLATALRLADELEAIVTYDQRMIEAAGALGLPVASPA
jgi:uncharacterized protein